jgi:thymidylate synthase (FAD)
MMIPEGSIRVGSGGFVHLVDTMGNDSAIVQAARVSYGEGTKSVSDDRTLIRMLLRHRHTTPFEMAEMKFLVRVPMDTWRQWIRHRTASVNEYSTRYSEAIDECEVTREWRLQSQSNKQGSERGEITWPSDSFFNESIRAIFNNNPGEYLSNREETFHQEARSLYKERLDFGIAREQARKDLPLSNYTEAYWKCDLHNILGFLRLRLAADAQLEIREFAGAIGGFVEQKFPVVWEAFQDYVINGVYLTGPEIKALRSGTWDKWLTKRECKELDAKVTKLGIF